MIYEYHAINRNGETVKDIIDAPNVAKAREKLKLQGLYITNINTQREKTSRDKKNEGTANSFIKKIQDYFIQISAKKEVGIFSRQLATLLTAGVPLLKAISDILEQTDNKNFKHIIADIKEKLEEGSSLSNAISRHNRVFSEMYINMIRVGENLGSLDKVVERLADIEEKNQMLKSKVSSALTYPAFMIILCIAVVIFIMTNIIPTLSEAFVNMGRELPLPTKIVLSISNFFSAYITHIIVLAIVGFVFLVKYKNSPEGKVKFDEIKLKLPIFKKLYNKMLVLKFTQNLGILLTNKVDIIRSFHIVKKIVNNSIIEKKIEDAAKKIQEGAQVSHSLSRSDFLPKLVIGMISAGEASDTLDTMLLNIGKVYENELDMTISGVTRLIEPLIILIMGVVIGLIVISVFLPMMEMNLMVK